jgi:ankyrin repeat protein
VQLLLERGADLEAQLDDHSTPLHIAAENGKVATVQVLLEHGFITHVRDTDGQIPLHSASSRQYLDFGPGGLVLVRNTRADSEPRTRQRQDISVPW